MSANCLDIATKRFVELAASDPSVIVRRQLACTAKRLARDVEPADSTLRLPKHAEDASDPYLPLLIWWASKHFAVPAREVVLAVGKARRVAGAAGARFPAAAVSAALRGRGERRRRGGLPGDFLRRPRPRRG